MENKEINFKVGDNVKVVESGLSYTTYDHMFRKLNFRNTDKNPSAPEGTIGTVFGVSQAHILSSLDICVAIRKQLGDIYPLVCESWQGKINEVLSQNPFNDIMEVDNELFLKVYRAANSRFHTIWLGEVTGGINSLKPQIALNKWYWVKAQGDLHKQDALIYVQDSTEDRKGNFGFSHSGKWLSGIPDKGGVGSYYIYKNLDYLRPATDLEVFEALKKEAIRRGLVEGVRIKARWIGSDSNESSHSLSGEYLFDEYTIKNSSVCTYGLMRDGIWATPIEEPKYIWLKIKRKDKIVIEQHPENQLVNLLSNGWEVVIESDLEQIKNELL